MRDLTVGKLRDMLEDFIIEGVATNDSVTEELHGIIEGAGWATDTYIINFVPDLSPQELYALMILMSKQNLLFDEENLPDDIIISEEMPSSEYLLSPEKVKEQYKYLKQGKTTPHGNTGRENQIRET